MLIKKSMKKLVNKGLTSFLRSFIRTIDKPLLEMLPAFIRYIRYNIHYSKACNEMYPVIFVSPNEIKYRVIPKFQNNLIDSGFYVIEGNWDQNVMDVKDMYNSKYEFDLSTDSRILLPYEQYSFHRAAVSHFQEKIPWEETKYYEYYCKKSNHGAGNEFKKFDRLYKDIAANGFKQQKELKNNSLFCKPPKADEIVVNVGRNGELIFEDGRHRLSVAKILELDEIPVRVYARHEKWQSLRKEIASASTKSDLSENAKRHLSHPDLTDVIDFSNCSK